MSFRSTLARVCGLTVGAAVAISLAGGTPARAASVQCGDTITKNTTLTRNLTCAGQGLTVRPGVTLDLGGHTLRGNGTGTAVLIEGETSTRATTIRHGRIAGWELGVRATPEFTGLDYPTLVLRGLTVSAAPLRFEASNVALVSSTVRDSPVSAWTTNLTARRSTLVRSTVKGEMGVFTLDRSRVFGGSWGAEENEQVIIKRSLLDGTGAATPATSCSVACTITDSTIRDYSRPIYAFGDATIKRSAFHHHTNGAIWSLGALSVSSSTFRRNGGTAITVEQGSAHIDQSRFSRNGTGLTVMAADPASTVRRSVFAYHTSDGVSSGAGVSFAGNKAVRNGGWGLHVPGAVDGGGNVARHNAGGDCLGLACG